MWDGLGFSTHVLIGFFKTCWCSLASIHSQKYLPLTETMGYRKTKGTLRSRSEESRINQNRIENILHCKGINESTRTMSYLPDPKLMFTGVERHGYENWVEILLKHQKKSMSSNSCLSSQPWRGLGRTVRNLRSSWTPWWHAASKNKKGKKEKKRKARKGRVKEGRRGGEQKWGERVESKTAHKVAVLANM